MKIDGELRVPHLIPCDYYHQALSRARNSMLIPTHVSNLMVLSWSRMVPVTAWEYYRNSDSKFDIEHVCCMQGLPLPFGSIVLILQQYIYESSELWVSIPGLWMMNHTLLQQSFLMAHQDTRLSIVPKGFANEWVALTKINISMSVVAPLVSFWRALPSSLRIQPIDHHFTQACLSSPISYAGATPTLIEGSLYLAFYNERR